MAQRIDKLTPQQEKAIDDWIVQWWNIGTSCEPAERQTAEQAIVRAYTMINEPAPRFIWCRSPAEATLAAHVYTYIKEIKENVEKALKSKANPKEVRREDFANRFASYFSELNLIKLGKQTKNENAVIRVQKRLNQLVIKTPEEKIQEQNLFEMDNLRTSILRAFEKEKQRSEKELEDRLFSLCLKIRQAIVDVIEKYEIQPLHWLWGQHEWWLAYYHVREPLGQAKKEDRDPRSVIMIDLAESCGWWAPYRGICFVCERPEEIHFNEADIAQRRVHRTQGPAVKFRDDWSVYAMNGVRVPEWLSMTPAEEIDPLRFAKIENAEIRREFVRKVGAERLAQKLGARVVDTEGDMYELLLIDLKGQTGEWPYLKMKNPSIQAYHIEPVERNIRTVKDAIAWRNQTNKRPKKLT